MQSSGSSNAYIAQRFASLIWSYLDADLLKTASFFAERYYAHDKSDHDARHLYATTLLRGGHTYSAMHLVDTSVSISARCFGCTELYSRCCSALGRHREAREVLQTCLNADIGQSSNAPRSREARIFIEPAVLRCRSAQSAMQSNLPDIASVGFAEALRLDPYLWEAFEGLCSLGSYLDVDELYPVTQYGPSPVISDDPSFATSLGHTVPSASGLGFFTPEAASGGRLAGPAMTAWAPPHQFRIDTLSSYGHRDSFGTVDSSFTGIDNSMHTQLRPYPSARTGATSHGTSRALSSADETGPAPKKARSTASTAVAAPQLSVAKTRARPALAIANFFSAPSVHRRPQPTNGVRKGGEQSATRKSSRLQGVSSKKGAQPNLKESSRRKRVQPARAKSMESDFDDEVTSPATNVPLSPRSEISPTPSNWTNPPEDVLDEQGAAEAYILALVRQCAIITKAMSQYDSQKVLDELDKLPVEQQNSIWAMTLTGRAHYEKVNYSEAERAFSTARQMDPYRLRDMEVYSTLLWHLQRNVQLSFLAQELLAIDSRSPEAWIAVGNCFSLQKERENAMAAFQRAAHLDPACAYAYTLSGHESLDEDAEKAVRFFQSALRADPRHYNAWYGLGTCYLRLSKLRLAEYHYRRALEIHPTNAVLLGCVGMAVERRGAQEEAFGLYEEAVRLAPENPLVRYRRAKVLISMKRYEDAVTDLCQLREIAPEESNVVFQLTKVYRLMGDNVRAARELAVARDMSPKSVNKLRKLLEIEKDGDGERMDEG